MVRRAGDVRVFEIDADRLDAAAALIAAEHRAAAAAGAAGFGSEDVCRRSLDELLEDGHSGFAAEVDGELAGVMCIGSFPPVGFVPAHGFVLRAGDDDPASIVLGMLAAITPRLVADGVTRLTVDHVATDTPRVGLHEAGFAMGSVFAVRSTEALSIRETPSRIRTATLDDLESVAELSQIEYEHRFTAPMHATGPRRSLGETRAMHAELLESGCVHLVATLNGRDVGLLTLEESSPAPRLCPHGAYIGPTATRPDVRGAGVGTALVAAAVETARSRGERWISVDFDSTNPVSRGFWLGLGFTVTGHRQRRTIGPS